VKRRYFPSSAKRAWDFAFQTGEQTSEGKPGLNRLDAGSAHVGLCIGLSRIRGNSRPVLRRGSGGNATLSPMTLKVRLVTDAGLAKVKRVRK